GGRARKDARNEGGRKPRRNTVSGLEVIEINEPDADTAVGDVPRGLEVADTGPSRHDPAAEPALAGHPAPAGAESQDDAPVEEPAGDAPPAQAEDNGHAVEPGDERDPAHTVGRPDLPDRTDELFGDLASRPDQDDGDDDDDDAGPGDDAPPRSMAESAGLGDSERVSEEVPDAAAEPAEDGSAGEERPRDDDRAA